MSAPCCQLPGSAWRSCCLKSAVDMFLISHPSRQGVVCSSLYSFGVIATAEQAKILQDFLTLIEMVLAAAIMSYAFPWKEYMMLSGHRQGLQIETIRDAVSIHDVVSDTYHSFAPAYHDYVLYSDGNKTPISSAKKGRSKKKFRARTFLMMGQESTAQHAGQHMETGKEMEMRMWNGGQSPSDCGSHETEDLTRSSTTPIIQGSSRPPSECNMDIINEDPYDCEFGDVNRLDRGPAAEVKANNVDDDAEQAASSQQAVAGRKWVHIDLDTKK